MKMRILKPMSPKRRLRKTRKRQKILRKRMRMRTRTTMT